ncbi:uncharacterized protein LOC125519154 [Triticum urartu]|uniref:uncharacterized protein LOC125519154 n=1 Tax=Triticum urartu TaxID=4572 RepID=UPI0020444D3B|nr:uncharacterized protein LOC125519154 [Triticum urartu]
MSLLMIGIASVVPRRALRLGDDGPQARGTAVTASSEVVEEAAPRLIDCGQQLLLDGEAVAARPCGHTDCTAVLLKTPKKQYYSKKNQPAPVSVTLSIPAQSLDLTHSTPSAPPHNRRLHLPPPPPLIPSPPLIRRRSGARTLVSRGGGGEVHERGVRRARPDGGGVGEWRKDWPLRSGGFAVLCDKCGQMKAVEDHKGSLLLYRISTHKGSLLHFTETHDVGNGKGAKS